jgi:glycosyltransferase involved in cell wall biosynthesis
MSEDKGSILFVIGTLDVGGTELHLSKVARALQKRGWRITVYCLSAGGPLQAELERDGIRIKGPRRFRTKARSWLFRGIRAGVAFWHLFWVLRRNRYDVVHFFLPSAYLLGGSAALLAGVPIRVMSRRSLNAYQKGHPFCRILECALHQRMTAVLANSRRICDELERSEGVPAEKLGLIYNGVDEEFLNAVYSREDARTRNGLKASEFVISMVANLIPYKGHKDLLEALSIARPNLPIEWKLLVIGRDDGIGNELRERALFLGIAEHLSFLGSCKNISELLAASDLGVLCSHEEGFSNALLEGMAAGLPMVVTNVGGNCEAVEDGISGAVVRPRDPRALAKEIVKLASDKPLRAKLGAAAKARVMQTFTFEKCLTAYEKFYISLLHCGVAPTEVTVSDRINCINEISSDFINERAA